MFLFALLGIATGSLYALSALGIVLTYRASGVVNFASGAMGMVAAFVFWQLTSGSGWSWIPALAVSLAVGAALGAVTERFLIRPLGKASQLTRIVMTLAVFVVLQGLVNLKYSPITYTVQGFLPLHPVHIGGTSVGANRLILIGLAVLLTSVLWAAYRFTRVGLATAAVADNRTALETLGWSPDRIACVNWALGAALSALGSILLAPIVGLSVGSATALIVPALAAAVIGNLTSFPLALIGGIVVGVVQSELSRYVNVLGLGDAVPLAAIIAVVVIRGRSLPLRSFTNERLPTVTRGRVSLPWLLTGIALTLAAIFVLPNDWVGALSVTLIGTVLLMSLVVVTGFAGQISLAQWPIAGLGALVTA
jgi:branched-subunit amino acid ABC-type transport system permease component